MSDIDTQLVELKKRASEIGHELYVIHERQKELWNEQSAVTGKRIELEKLMLRQEASDPKRKPRARSVIRLILLNKQSWRLADVVRENNQQFARASIAKEAENLAKGGFIERIPGRCGWYRKVGTV